MRLHILQTLAWINVAAGAFLACGGLLLVYIVVTSPERDEPIYLRALFVLIPLSLALAFILTGSGFLKKKTQSTAEVSASGFALLIWLMLGSFFEDIIPDSLVGPLPGSVAGIFFAYACFLALKLLVIKPHFTRTATQDERLATPATG